MNRFTGSIKFFNQTKGFGFIIPDEEGPDVFVHTTKLDMDDVSELGPGFKVSYEV